MIFFDRPTTQSSIPRSLTGGKEIETARRAIDEHMNLPVERRRQTDIPPVWKTPLGPDVLAALEQITQGRCAFCETSSLLSVYRFRPPAYAQPTKPAEHDESYLWLAFEWENFFPICERCRPKVQSYFPVKGDRTGYQPSSTKEERATLIFPGELTQPFRHFSMAGNGEFIGVSERAQFTIEHFDLNHSESAEQRHRTLLDTRNSLRDSNPNKVSQWSRITGFGAWYLYLRRLARHILDSQSLNGSLSPAGISQTMDRLSRNPNFGDQVDRALGKMDAEDGLRRQGLQGTGISRVGKRRTDDRAVSPLRIAGVDLTTYKSLERISFDVASRLSDATTARLISSAAETSSIPEAPCVLILGENATGKSSILEAIALALMPEDVRTRLKIDPSSLTLNPEYMGVPGEEPVRESEISLSFHGDDGSSQAPDLKLLISASPRSQNPFDQLSNLKAPLPPVFAYGAHRLYGKQSRRSALRHVETLFHNDRQLPKPEIWLQKLDEDNLNQVARALRHLIRIDGDFHTIEVDKLANECKINVEKIDADGEVYIVPYRLDIVSSGYRAIFALLCDVLEGLTEYTRGDVFAARQLPAVVLIDEIEAHLHPRWKLHVITGLRRALPKATFIITSHDPLCVRGMFNGEVVALNRYQNTSRAGLGMPERVEPVEGFENIEAQTIEQLLTSELFQLLSTDNPETDRAIAKAADSLSQSGPDQELAESIVQEMDEIVRAALPFGQSDLARVVQEAVSEFLSERRGLDHKGQATARRKAKDEIKKRLKELMQ